MYQRGGNYGAQNRQQYSSFNQGYQVCLAATAAVRSPRPLRPYAPPHPTFPYPSTRPSTYFGWLATCNGGTWSRDWCGQRATFQPTKYARNSATGTTYRGGQSSVNG